LQKDARAFSKVPEDDALGVYRGSLKADMDDGSLSPAAQEPIISFQKSEVKIEKDVFAQRIFNFSMLLSILGDKAKGK
jgi:hypothetical protein